MAKPWEVVGKTRPWAQAKVQETAVTEQAARRAAAPAKAREAFERSRNSPESIAARERDAQHPIVQYLSDYAGGIGDAFKDVYEDYDPIKATVGTVEGGASLASSVAAPLFGAVDKLVGNVIPDERNPENSYAVARDKYVYEPRSETGQDVVQAAGSLLKPVGDLFQSAGEQAGEGLEGVGASPGDVQTAREIIPDILGFAAEAPAARAGVRAVDKRIPQAPPKMPGPPLPKAATERQAVARAADIKIPPSAVPDAKGTLLESTVGTPQAQARAALRNQPTINRHVRAELGLKGEQNFSTKTFRDLEKPQTAVYDEVRNTLPALAIDETLAGAIDNIGKAQRDNPLLEVGPAVTKLQERLANQGGTLKTADVMNAVRDWRFKARKLYQSIDDPAKHEQAKAFQSAADSFEDAIERQAPEGMGQKFRDARTSLAKIHDFESAMVDGNIDISVLTKMKEAGKPLSGRAAMLADIGRWFGPETQTASSVRIPVSTSVPLWRILLGRGAQTLARRPIDDIIFSERYQRQFGDVDAAPGPGSPLGAYFDAPRPAPKPSGPKGPQGSGSVDFSRSPEVPPAAALRPGERVEFARDESADAAIPQAENRAGDLTASEPPVIEGLPFEGSDLVPAGDLAIAPEAGTFPGARIPEEAALTEFFSDQPIERRRKASGDRGPDERRSSILRERQAVLDRPVGSAPLGQELANALLEDPRIRAAVENDTRVNRAEINPGDDLPTGAGFERGAPTAGPTVSEFGDFERTGRTEPPMSGTARVRQNADELPETNDFQQVEPSPEGDLGFDPAAQVDDASIQQTIDTLRELGFTPEEIQEILTRKG